MALLRLEPMTVGRILDQAMRLYRENFLRYVTITAVVQVPTGLLMVAGSGIFYSNFTSMAPGGRPPDLREMGTMVVGLLAIMGGTFLHLVSMVLAMAAMARSLLASYLGGDLTVGQAYRSLAPRAGWLFLLILMVVPSIFVLYIGLILVILAIAIAMMGVAATHLGTAATAVIIIVLVVVATLVLGVFVLAWGAIFSLSVQSTALEDLNTFAAIGRSVKLLRGNLRKAIGAVLFTSFLVFIPAMAAASIGYLLGYVTFGPANMMALQVIQQSVSLFMQVLVMPVWASVMLLLYYDLRIRKEGFDLEMLAASLRPGEPAADGAAR
jgi:hypothetical protein